jgi:hypothetical protein
VALDSADNAGYIRISPLDASGRTEEGYNINGYDRLGRDKDGYDKDGYDHSGWDKNGYDRSGRDKDGYDKNGYDLLGRDKNGYDRSGWDKNGYDRNGQQYDRYGYDKNGYNRSGYNRNGYDRSGLNKNGYDKNGVKYGIGMASPSGGYIFYDKGAFSDGWRFLEAAPVSAEFEADWVDAKRRCQNMTINGFGGWRLPTKDELNLMYINLKQKGLEGFKNDLYWSSSEHFTTYAWYQRFSDGSQYTNDKTITNSVRAVRAF